MATTRKRSVSPLNANAARHAGAGKTPPSMPKRKPKPRDDQYFSRAVDKAFLVLNTLNGAESPVSLNQITSSIGLSKSSSFRLLHTLERLKYINQDAAGRYTIAESSWVTPSMQVANLLSQSALQAATALHDEFQETVSIAVLFANHIEVVRVLESNYVVRMANTVGRILPPHASSMGKAITAFQPDEVCRKLLLSYGLIRFTASTITDEPSLAKELDQIRKDRFAHEGEESTPDGCCFGAPIFLDGPWAVAAISVSMPKSRLPEGEARTNMVAKLQAAAKAITAELRAAVKDRLHPRPEPPRKDLSQRSKHA